MQAVVSRQALAQRVEVDVFSVLDTVLVTRIFGVWEK